ncbi:hypothetical protein [Dokdonella sp.]|uniref:hypothetical protein n=1 Tax=Dokdonella sp. TaxID=2291710 RepID=UPI003C385D6F
MWGSSATGSGLRTPDTTSQSRIHVQSTGIQFLAADVAIAIFTPFQAEQCAGQSRALDLPPALCFKRQFSRLHSVHAGQSAEARLIELDWLVRIRRQRFYLFQFMLQ